MTFAAAKAALAADITAALGDSTVQVLPFDGPAVGGDTVTVSTAGLSPTEYRLFIRIYVSTIQSQEGQDRLDVLTETIDAAPGFAFPRPSWEFVFDQVKESFYMVATVEYPRLDF
jgi:hypothetical protein